MAVWYARDNSTAGNNYQTTASIVPGSVGWSAVTAWSASASIASGTLRRQSAGTASFTASASTTTLTVSAVSSGTIYLGMLVETSANAAGSGNFAFISAYGTGTGGTGTYTLNVSATAASTTWVGGFQFGNQRVYVATQSATGTTGSTEPDWSRNSSTNITKGAKITDNTVTWVECTGQPAVNGDMTNTPASSTVRSVAQSVGKIIKDNGATHIFICTTAGTPGSGEPTYVTTSVGSTTTDGGATWTYIGASFSNWAAPFGTMNNAFGTNWAAAGDILYVGDDHSEITASASGNSPLQPVGVFASPNFIYSIDHTLSLPVSSGGLKAGAKTATSGITGMGIANVGGTSIAAYIYGITFDCGSGVNAALNLTVDGANSQTWLKFDSCAFKLTQISSSGVIRFGSTASTLSCQIELVNTTVQFGNIAQSMAVNILSSFIWRNTASAITGATFPTTFFASGLSGNVVLEGVDLSALGSGKTLIGTQTGQASIGYSLIDCKLGSSVTVAATPANPGGPQTDVIRCNSTSSTYLQRRYRYSGTLQEEATIIRTGGASDGTTGISWNIATTANSKWVLPFESFPIAIWNGVTATNRTITLHGIWNSASLPNNDDVWIDVAYLGDSGSPQASFGTETKSNNLASGSALTADSSSAWDSQASARQNSHAYSLGDVIKTSSNAGRIFFCTTAGTSNGTEPVGYAGAADGGSVTDSGAVFRAGTRFLLTVTLSTPQPQLVGYLRAYVKAAKVSSTFYVDPLIVLS